MKIHLAMPALSVCLMFVGASQAQFTSERDLVKTRAVLSVDQVPPGGTFEVSVIADLEKGWHINAHKPTLDYLIPTELSFQEVEHLTIGAVQYPTPVKLKFDFAEESLDVYEGRVTFRLGVAVAPDASPARKTLEGKLRYQACNAQVCLPPASVELSIPIEIVSPDHPDPSIDAPVVSHSPPPDSAPASPTEKAPERVVASSKKGEALDLQTLLSVDKAHPGSRLQAAVLVQLQTGWHITAHQPALDYLLPTELRLQPDAGLQLGEIQYPTPVRLELEFAGQSLDVYQGEVAFRFPVSIAGDVSSGQKVIKAALRYQACNDTQCLPPATLDIDIPVHIVGLEEPSRLINADLLGTVPSVAPSPAAPGPRMAGSGTDVGALIEQSGLGLALIVIFGLGLALNLTPCVFPMIPITIGYFLNQGGGKTSRAFGLGLMYLLGIALMYTTLGVVAALTGQLFGSFLQNSWALVGVAAVMVLLSLSLFGLYQIRPPSFIMLRISAQGAAGLLGAVTMGLLVGVVAAPCVGPVTIGLLTYVGATGDPWLGFIMFFTLSVGLGVPYVALAVFSGGLKKLPRSGVWMVWVERLFGFVLLGVALYFVSISGLLPEAVISGLVVALALSAGVYLGWLDKSETGSRVFHWLKRAAGVGAVLIGIYFVWPSQTIAWQRYDPAILDRATQQGKPVVLDFYADWCIPCKELDRFTFADEEVIEAISGFVKLKVDLTHYESPESEALRKKFNVGGVPTIVFLNARGDEAQASRVIGYLGPGDFLQRVKVAQASN